MKRALTAAPAVTTALAGAAAAQAAYLVLRRRPPGSTGLWARINHRGEPVTLIEGPAAAAGAIAAALAAPGLPPRTRAALALAAGGAAGFGCYDDLAGSGKSRGFRGHLTALAHGEVTTGMVKLAGIGAAGAAASALLGGPAADQAINAGLVAGSANLLNLFDLRPGRASKVTVAWAALLTAASPAAGRDRGQAARSAAAAAAGPALGLLGEDLGERAMLGDAGANALGAVLGTAVAAGLPRSARLAVLAGIVGLTAASEKISFTKVIARTPALNKLDMLGRRPPAPQAHAPAGEAISAAGSALDGVEADGAGGAVAEPGVPQPSEAGPPAQPTSVP